MIRNLYGKGNNPYVPTYAASKRHNYLLYLDCTNLYGTAMTQPLPIADFRLLERIEKDPLDVHSLVTTAKSVTSSNYILGILVTYTTYIQISPSPSEKRAISDDMLSPYCIRMKMLKDFACSTAKVEKLITSLTDKTMYIEHYRMLKLYLELGIKLKAVHRVLSFRQCAWLKPFIDFNTAKRKDARNPFEKDFFKLMNSAPYGKSLENDRKRLDFHLVADERKLQKLTASPRLEHFFVYNEDLEGVSMKKRSVTNNRPCSSAPLY